jgi:hypothetical protein
MYNSPTDANIDATVAASKGAQETQQGKAGHAWATGILKPEQSGILTTLFPQYFGTQIWDKLGRYEAISRSVWAWNEQDRTRLNSTITSGGGATGATIDVVTDVAFDPGYYVVGDTLFTESGLQVLVTAVADSGGFEQLTLKKVDGTAFVLADTTDTELLGHIGSAFGEGSSAPSARKFYPNQRENHLTTIRRTCQVSGDALTDQSWIGDGEAWYYTDEKIAMAEFMRDRENESMFGQLSGNPTTSTADALKGEGIVTVVERGGVKTEYGGVVTEDDIQDHITDLVISSPASEYFVPCGAKYFKEVTQALKDYHINGAVSYGVFSSGVKLLGLQLQTYQFHGKLIHFAHYPMFDDNKTLPFSGTPTATKRNYSNFALFLNLGNNDIGDELIKMCYKELNGEQRKFIYKIKNGIPGSESNVATGDDYFESFMLSQVAPEVRALNQHGLMAQNA